MSTHIPFAQSLMRSYLIMHQCATRRSIISAVSQTRKKKLNDYENKKWIVKEKGGDLGATSYSVICKETQVIYLVKAFYVEYGFTWGAVTYSVYKKKVE